MRADHEKIKRLLLTARGQMEGLLKMVDEDRYCVDISNQLQATSAILQKANREVLRGHMLGCVREAFEQGNEEEKIEEVLKLMDKMGK